MNKLSYLILLAILMSCNFKDKKSDDSEIAIIKFWTITELQFNNEDITLDDCTKQDYLDIRTDGIALSFHCEYFEVDSIPSYHTHKLNWTKRNDSMYNVFSDDKSVNGSLYLNDSGLLEMIVQKSDNRTMKAVFK
ncbi:hypothetical protein [Winogradskyella sp.]|uniref:hypothetical protein n=1 Tax=Winogradskyella sp. TaxID=1883156 RepID=UPI003BA8CF82